MFDSAVRHRHGAERAWTEHLATPTGAIALLDVVRTGRLPDHLLETLGEIVDALAAEVVIDADDDRVAAASHLVTHQLHLDGRFPDVAVHDVRDRLFAVIEAQRGRADDRHIAKLAAHYVPGSGARLGILVAEGWRARDAGHPAWGVCPAPVVVVVALDTMHHITYEVAWVHHPPTTD